jgi:predicted outer membrane repeat protein
MREFHGESQVNSRMTLTEHIDAHSFHTINSRCFQGVSLMKVLHCVLLFLLFGFSSVGMAQKLIITQTSVALFQGGDSVSVFVGGTPGMNITAAPSSNSLRVSVGRDRYTSKIYVKIAATKNTPLGLYSVKVKGEFKKKIASGTINVKVIRFNKDPEIRLFTLDQKTAIQGEEVKFTVSVSDLDGDPLTCYLDVDGNGKPDYTKQNCTSWIQSHTYSVGGKFKPSLTVQDAFGGNKTSNDLETLRDQPDKMLFVELIGNKFVLDTQSDTQDVLPGDSKCTDENQKCSLRAAVMELNASKGIGTIQVPSGSYKFALEGDDDSAQRGDLDITGKIKIYGENAESTFIDANQTDRVFQMTPSAQLWLTNITVRGGKTPVNCYNCSGGGIFVVDDYDSKKFNRLEIRNCVFENNQVGGYGGAILSENFTIVDSVFRNNLTNTSGGALSGNGLIINSNFIKNTSVGEGGAITSNKISIENSNFIENKSGKGGAIYLNGKGIIKRSIFKSNLSSNVGGGIFYTGNVDYPLLISQSIFDANKSVDGAGIYSQSGKITISSSVLSNNISENLGGGIYSTSSYGHADLSIMYSTIVNNKAKQGGGLHIQGDQRQDSFKATLLTGNVADSGPDCFGALTSTGYNLVQSPKDCRFVAAHRDSAGKVTDHVAENPQLQSMVDSYFGTLFTPSNPVLINAIPKADCTLPDGTPLETDMLGKPRFQGSGCDIGAIEVR